ncbi:MAG TPA: hypothetical protein VL460_02110 [Caulobacteraceae bacterium]|jgi:hypothetical protein|nr:hypothetical protein [Caulobacteraceae bacterium]
MGVRIISFFMLSAAAMGALSAAALDAGAAEPPAHGSTVAPLTVRPQSEPVGRVIASSEAAPLTAPDFTAKDAQHPPLAVRIAPGAALGRQTVRSEPPPGLLRNNPDLGPDPAQAEVGITALF